MNKWLANHSISAKSFITVWGFVVILWASNEQFRAYILGIYSALPHAVHNFIAGVAIPALILWRTQKRTTVTAEVIPGDSTTAAATAIVTK